MSIYVALLGLSALPVIARDVPMGVAGADGDGVGRGARALATGAAHVVFEDGAGDPTPAISKEELSRGTLAAAAVAPRPSPLSGAGHTSWLLAGRARRIPFSCKARNVAPFRRRPRCSSSKKDARAARSALRERRDQAPLPPLHRRDEAVLPVPPGKKERARRCRRAPRPSSWWCRSKLSVLNHRPRAPWRPRERRSRPRAGCVRAQQRPSRCRAAWSRPRSES